MADAAQHSGHDPDRMSFVAALRIARQSIAPGAFSPPDDNTACDRLWQLAISRLVHRLNPKRRLRAAPRVIKRKMSKWHVKRAHHADWPQPQRPTHYTVDLGVRPARKGIREVRVCRGYDAVVDDPNLVSCAGLAPVLRLAERVGLQRLVAEPVKIDKMEGGYAALRSRLWWPGWSPARTPLMTWRCCGTAG